MCVNKSSPKKTLPVGVFLEDFSSEKAQPSPAVSDSKLSHSDVCYLRRFHLSHVGLMIMAWRSRKRKSLHSCSVSCMCMGMGNYALPPDLHRFAAVY